MPVIVPRGLPAARILQSENIPALHETDPERPPVRVGILNLMPTKEVTETQLLRILGNTALPVEAALLKTATHESSHASPEHMRAFYRTFDQVRDVPFDGLIITGAPVEMMDFEEVDYWGELVDIMDWADENVASTFYICWAAQAGLYHYYGVPKYELPKKCFGIFSHRVTAPRSPLTRGFDPVFNAPHSRHTEVRLGDLEKAEGLDLLAVSDRAGAYLAASRDGKRVFVTGHSEYDPDTLRLEYERDVKKGLQNVDLPYHYFADDDPRKPPMVTWRAHANLLYQNWLNHCVAARRGRAGERA